MTSIHPQPYPPPVGLRDVTDPHPPTVKQRGILVVDDDALLLSLLSLALEKQGFPVWVASGGVKALEVYQRHRAQIQIVLLDVRMPGWDGPRTLAELQRLNPAVVCCFMSGHTGEYTPAELLGRGALYLFDKPFHMEEIVRVLAGLIAAHGDRQAFSA